MIYHFAPWPIRPNMLLVTAIRFHSCDAAPSTSLGSALTENAKGGIGARMATNKPRFLSLSKGTFPQKNTC